MPSGVEVQVLSRAPDLICPVYGAFSVVQQFMIYLNHEQDN